MGEERARPETNWAEEEDKNRLESRTTDRQTDRQTIDPLVAGNGMMVRKYRGRT